MGKIGIVTYWQMNNYGAALQAYALQKTLENKGEQAELINYRCSYLEKPYSFECFKKKGILNYLLGIAGHLSRIPTDKNFREFRKELSVGPRVRRNDLKTIEKEYDKFISGSDQVWNYKVNGLDEAYFLGFVTNPNKKYSYAASVGIKEIPDELEEKYKDLLKGFRNLCVREQESLKLVEGITNRSVVEQIDPTLLLRKEQYMRFISPENKYGDYILVYQLGMSKDFLRFVERAAEIMKYKVVVIPFPRGRMKKAKYVVNGGPKEFLNLIWHAKYVITDSFHGTVFSIIFNKNFGVGIFGEKKETSGRIYSLLQKFGLEKRIFCDINGVEVLSEISDYEHINRLLELERSKALGYIDDVIIGNAGRNNEQN